MTRGGAVGDLTRLAGGISQGAIAVFLRRRDRLPGIAVRPGRIGEGRRHGHRGRDLS